MNNLNDANTPQPSVILLGTLSLPVGVKRPSQSRRGNKQPIEKWKARVQKRLGQCNKLQETVIIVISSKKKQNKISISTKTSLLRCPRTSCNVTKALLMADKIDRKNDPLRTLGYTKKCDKQRVFLASLYR